MFKPNGVFYTTSFEIKLITYLLRTIHPDITHEFTIRLNKSIRIATEHIIDAKVTDLEWSQIVLPIRKSGCGIQDFKQVRLAAFLASYKNCFEDIEKLSQIHNLNLANNAYCNSIQNHIFPCFQKNTSTKPDGTYQYTYHTYWNDEIKDKLQHHLTHLTHDTNYGRFLNTIRHSKESSARILSASQSQSGAWLMAFPVQLVPS